jgi:hypothetical protein
MSYYELPEMQYKAFQAEIMEAVLLDPVDMLVCNFKSMGTLTFQETWTQVQLPYDDEIWNKAPIAPQESADVDFKDTTDYTYVTGRVIRLNKARVEASLNMGAPLDTTVVAQVIRRLNKYREAFIFQGPKDADGNRYDTQGLFNKAGNSSTYTTVKFASAGGPYNTVNDMLNALQTDGFGFGRVDLIADTTLAPYFRYLPSTSSEFSEAARIKRELLNGGNIYVSNQLPAASSNDGVLLLVDNKPQNYKAEYPGGAPVQFNNQFVWDPETNEFVGRVDLYLRLKTYQPNAICKHVTVDLAS